MAGAIRLQLDTAIVALHRAECKGAMDDLDRPDLGPFAFEQIEQELHEIDLRYWQELREMQVPKAGTVFAVLLKTGMPPPPRSPKRPQHLLAILRRYAEALFYVEASKYPPISPQFLHWLTNLTERCGTRVMQNVKNLEAGSLWMSLTYHGVTEAEMQEAVDEAGRVMTDKFTGDRVTPKPIPNQQATSPKIENRVSPITAPKKRRLGASITCPSAARKLEKYLQDNGIGLTDFASRAQTTDRTLRRFRKTGTVRRDIFEGIAKAMGKTKEELLKE